MKKIKLFVTGGAGYIGSHFVKNCYEQTHFIPEILIYDDLSNGFEKNILYGEFVHASLDDKVKLKETLNRFQPDIVVHFAAFIQVGESEQEPWKYYKNNTENTLTLLKYIDDLKIPHFIFSSTAAVYGSPENAHPILETDSFAPINVYGHSKCIVEEILHRSQSVLPFSFLAFRYFNVAGADPQSRIGQCTKDATHLIARAMEVAFKTREYLPIYGDDYPTSDGTCIRDYIHVDDLVNAHILGVTYLINGGDSDAFNLGYGKGSSVKDVINVVKEVIGQDLPVKIEPRRIGDPPILVANSDKIQKILGWKPEYNDLFTIIQHAYFYEKQSKQN